ncbi:MAG: CBS domain-containing protein [Alphaproteobacteria bacterium]|nr:CBS domain-containing protein [Alphaproteobacteria bacterium]
MTELAPLARIDSFAYRHRLSEVMTKPVLAAPPTLSVHEACDRMARAAASSLVVIDDDGRAEGIFTERDLLKGLQRRREAALSATIGELMSRPAQLARPDDFLFVALARMMRLGLRHLVVVDDQRRPLGIVTGRAVLQMRVSEAILLGDGIAQAQSAEQLAEGREALPGLAGRLLAEGVPARDIAAVLSGALRDMTARAAQLAEKSMTADGWGAPPAQWCLLVLGSAGRGESLLAFDQDNAIVHAGTEADDAWFAEMGKRVADTLNAAGIPYCDGLVMASNPAWRRGLASWKDEVFRWVHQPEAQTVMNTDIFFDFQPVHGDRALADELRRHALDTAAGSNFFLQLLANNVSKMEVPVGIFGEFVTTHGRLNAKKFGLLPLVSAARAKAVRARIEATGTAERYAELTTLGQMHADDRDGLCAVHELVLRVILDQQLADLAAGVAPSARIEPRHMTKETQVRLKAAFKRIRVLKTLLGGLVTQ